MDASYLQYIILTLGENNPGAIKVINKIFYLKTTSFNVSDKVLFFQKLEKSGAVGHRLWYLYYNICKKNIYQMIELDLDMFNNKYFYNIVDKYY